MPRRHQADRAIDDHAKPLVNRTVGSHARKAGNRPPAYAREAANHEPAARAVGDDVRHRAPEVRKRLRLHDAERIDHGGAARGRCQLGEASANEQTAADLGGRPQLPGQRETEEVDGAGRQGSWHLGVLREGGERRGEQPSDESKAKARAHATS